MGEKTVCLQCASETELDQLQRDAEVAGLKSYLVQDAGRTQVAASSKTVLAIGPAPEDLINTVTGKLRLF